MRRILVIALLVPLAAACSTTDADEPDASAQLACRHFRNVAADAADGILTDAELRDKLAEVDDDAQVSDEPGIATHARAMLAGITSGSDDEFAQAITDFGDACAALGL